jgi:hemerythrin-like domain-containing protein
VAISIGRGPRHAAAPGLTAALLECHARIRGFLDLAAAIAARDDVTDAEAVEACVRVERYFREALPLHVADERDSIAPRLRHLAAELDARLDAMHEEHDRHEALVRDLLVASGAVRESPGDSVLRGRLAAAAAALAGELGPHMDAEEALVFPALDARLDEAGRAAILAELRARRGAG